MLTYTVQTVDPIVIGNGWQVPVHGGGRTVFGDVNVSQESDEILEIGSQGL